MDVLYIIIGIASGACICIPLALLMATAVHDAAQSRNWNKIVSMIAAYMAEAETRLSDGATRKEWVMGMIRASADTLDYKITPPDWEKIERMIDELAEMAKGVNIYPKKAGER